MDLVERVVLAGMDLVLLTISEETLSNIGK
jgi:hypothetical protein